MTFRSPLLPAAVLVLLLALYPEESSAQDRRFRGGVLLGFNASQIDGDELWGHNKAGLNLGGRFLAIINPRMDISMDLLYSQRGSQSQLTFDNSIPLNRYNLHYLEVPFIFHFKDWAAVSVDEESFYRVEATAGLAYSRLIRARMYNNPFEGREDLLRQNDFSWLVGFGFHATPRQGFHFRYTSSINRLFTDQESLNTKDLRGYFLTLQYLYAF